MTNNLIPLEDVIRILGLEPLAGEGGLWAQGILSDEQIPAGQFEGRPTDRPLYGTIYYLLTPESFSCMHRLATDEVWYHHCGPAAKLLLIYPGGECMVRLLGHDLLNGEVPQIVVPRGVWQGCVMDDKSDKDGTLCEDESCGKCDAGAVYTLMSTSMAPAYQVSDFEAGSYEELKQFVPEELDGLLRRLTSEPVYK